MKKRFTEEQIIGLLREADAGLPVKQLCRKHGFSEPSYYAWMMNGDFPLYTKKVLTGIRLRSMNTKG